MGSPCTLDEAIAALRRGGVIAYPTEAVWGLGCDPLDQAAVLRLLALKQREVDKGLVLIAASQAHLAPYMDLTSLGDAHLAELDPRIMDGVDAVLEGETGGLQRPTQIRDTVTGRVLRN